jgi:HK97 family phage major capsid protein
MAQENDIKKLYEQRAEAAKELEEVRSALKKDAQGNELDQPRTMTSDEREKFDKSASAYDELQADIDRLEKIEDVRSKADLQVEDKDREGFSQGIDESVRCKALQGALLRHVGTEISDEHRDALQKAPVYVDKRGNFVFPLQRQAPRSVAEAREIGQRAGPAGWETGTDAEGGYTVPTTLMRELEIARLQVGPVLSVVRTMRTASGETLNMPTADDTSAAGEWISEESTASTDNTDIFGNVQIGANKWSSKVIPITAELLEDSAFDLAAIVGQLIGERWGRAEADEVTNSTNFSGGILSGATSNSSNSVGSLEADDVLNLVYAVPPAYTTNQRIMMHNQVAKSVRQLTDGNSAYIWQPGLQQGEPPTLAGVPVVMNQDMNDTISGGNDVMVSGNFNKYVLREVNNMRMYRLNELYRESDQVGFIAFHRADGKLVDAGAGALQKLTISS